jgi:DNA-binding response OmpR family regulator
VTGGRPSVLVVEDDPDLAALEQLILAEAGFAVRTAADGAQALAAVAEELPGLILLDMRLPVMNGWEFARELRARHGSAVPIVVVTAAENARARAEEIGAEGWLEKPFDLDAVVAAVRRFVRAPGSGAVGERPSPGGG